MHNHTKKHCCYAASLLIMLVFVSCAPVYGQGATASATVAGTVTDSSGAVVEGATVTVTSQATAVTRTTVTSSIGLYRFDAMPPGSYTIRASKSGFRIATAPSVELQVGATTTRNFVLEPGAQSEVVEVMAETPLLDQAKTSIGLTISPSQIEDLPLNGRNFENLAYLAPGAKPTAPWDPTKARVAGVGINGSNGRNMNITVNGVDDKDNTVGGPVMQLPLEAVEEFNISTNRFSAANGRSSGAAVNVITRTGTNNFHGSGYFFDTQTALNANDKLNADAHNPTSQFERQQFGGRFGGPIVKEKTFGFVAIERLREHTSIPVLPQAFSELSLVSNLNVGNITLKAQPAQTIPTPYFDWRYNARLDHHFSSKHRAFITYSAQTNKDLNDQSSNSNDLSEGNFQNNQLIITNATLTSELSPRLVNTFTAGFQYWNNLIDSNVSAPLFVFPKGISFGTNTNVPQQSYQRKYQFRDDIVFTKGNHGMKFGVDYLWEPSLGGFFKFNSTLEVDFQDFPSVILSNTTKYPQGFSTPGAVTGMSISNGDPREDLPGGAKMLGLYYQDTWKATRKLTLDLGLRYDRDFNLLGTNTQAKSRTYQLLRAINSPYAGIPEDDTLDFSPRVGFAYDLTGSGNNIIRGGYGLYYDQVFLNIPLFMIQQANPTLFATVFSINGSGPGNACKSACIVPGTNIPLSSYRLGIDPQPTIPQPLTSLIGGAVGRLMSPDYRNPYSQQWNIGFAHSFSPSTALEVDYVHTLGLHEEKRQILNYLDPTNDPTQPCTPADCTGGTRVLSSALAAAGQPQIARISMETPWGRSRYDGLNVSLRRRLAKRFSVNATYTLSKGLAYNGNAASYSNTVTDPRSPLLPSDFGVVPNDERHHVGLGAFVQLPWGFEVAPVLQAGSARPYNATNGVGNVLGFGSGPAAAHAIVPTNDPTNLLWETTQTLSALRYCYLVSGTCKQVNWDYLRGQAFFNLDTRVTKVIRLGEQKHLKLIFQMFDVTNRANFGNSFDGNVHNYSSDPTKNTFQTPTGYVGCNSSGCNRNIPIAFRGEFGVQFTF